MTVAATSMRTVPATVGVIIRRSRESREMSANWTRAGNGDEAGQHRGPARQEGGDADCDERGGGNHAERVPGPELPDPDRLENGAQSADCQRSEEYP